jgi:hypothetical protein
LRTILGEVKRGNLDESDVKRVFRDMMEMIPLEEAIKKEQSDSSDVEEDIMNIIREKPGLSPNAYMGLVMRNLNGRISGKEAIEIIKKYVK